MKTGWVLFIGLAVFYAILTVIYWQVGGEAVGITAIALSAGLALIIGFYLCLPTADQAECFQRIINKVRLQIQLERLVSFPRTPGGRYQWDYPLLQLAPA